MAKKVSLDNGRIWRSKKDAIAHFRLMLSRYGDGDKISDASDDSDLRSLLNRYDSLLPASAPSKIGHGVAYFSRERNVGDGWASSGFHVHRTDGTSTDFSFYSAIQMDPKS